MAIYCRGSNVAEIYRRGTKVLQVYKKGALVYDAGGGEAFGGYIKEGLVLQLDCRRIDVDSPTQWVDLIHGEIATIQDAEISTKGIIGGSINLPSVIGGAYYEVAKVADGKIYTMQVSAYLPSSIVNDGTIFSIRLYEQELSNENKILNHVKDVENFTFSYPFVFSQEFSNLFE